MVAEAGNGQEAVELARSLQPDVILMDLKMPVMDGLQAVRLITKENPAARVIMLTLYFQNSYLLDALKAGARGYLLKDLDEQSLIKTIWDVYRNGARLDPRLTARLLGEFRRLSEITG